MTTLSQQWADATVRHLVKSGVRSFCIAPGSRNTPLIMSCASHPLAEVHVHFDERGLGFFALGMAKAKKGPVALVVTSGTALGNLYPAIMEAKLSHTPLIVITADRPFELHDTHANQTVDQTRFFGEFVEQYTLLPPPDEKIPLSVLKTTMSYAVMKAKSASAPVHINMMQRGPFHPHQPNDEEQERTILFTKTTPTIETEDLTVIIDSLNESKKGLVIMASGSEADFELCEKLNWPIFADITSGARSKPHPLIISHASLIAKTTMKNYTPEMILILGESYVAKELYLWMESIKAPIIQVTPHVERADPTHKVTTHVCAPISTFIEAITPHIHQKEEVKFFEKFRQKSETITTLLNTYTQKQKLSEIFFFHAIQRHFDESTALFIGNSLAVRAIDHTLYPKNPIGPIYTNRGCSGIDGNIATIAGICAQSKMPTVAFIGDQAFLHDINSLPLIRDLPITLVVLNNMGGRIFEYLPIQQNKEGCEKYLVNPQHYQLDHAGSLFDIPYHIARNTHEFIDLFPSTHTEPQVIELTIDPEIALNTSQAFMAEVAKSPSLMSALSCYFE